MACPAPSALDLERLSFRAAEARAGDKAVIAASSQGLLTAYRELPLPLALGRKPWGIDVSGTFLSHVAMIPPDCWGLLEEVALDWDRTLTAEVERRGDGQR